MDYMDERTREFTDAVNMINAEAGGLGYKTGIDWAEKAGVLGASDAGSYKGAHYLRNAVAHGRAKDVRVTQETLDFVNAILLTIQATTQASNASKSRRAFFKKLFGNEKDDLPDAQKPLDVDDRTHEFLNVIEVINAEAGGLGYRTGIDWAENAGVLGAGDASNFRSCHYLRLAAMHGRAKDVHVTQETLDFVLDILQAIQEAGQTAETSKPRTAFFHKLFNKKQADRPAAEPAEAPRKPEPKPDTLEWYLQNAEKGDASAQFELGRRYANGDGVAEDKAEAMKWYRMAAEQGNADAQCGLGLLYRDRDPQEEGKWLLLAAKQGHEDAQIALCVKKTGVDVPEDRDLEKIFIAQAETGDSHEMYCMGRYYLDGVSGVPKNLAKAKEWMTKAAELGHRDAQYAMGNFYRVEDPKEAQKWYLKAAEQGHAQAQIDLAQLYCEGDMYDDKESQKWLIKAAQQGDRIALDLLADYETDEDALDGDDTLEERYIAEARAGAPGAMYELGYNYLYGCGGVRKNLEKAVQWLTWAAERGDGDAMYELGCCYENGWGVDQDEDEARQWYWEAFVQGSDEAEIRLQELREEEED